MLAINSLAQSAHTYIIDHCTKGSPEEVELFEKWCAVNPKYNLTDTVGYGNHALFFAINQNHLLLCQYIVNTAGNAILQQRNKEGICPLSHAISTKSTKISECRLALIKGLVNLGADVNVAQLWTTPLILAAQKANLALVTFLLLKGATNDVKDLPPADLAYIAAGQREIDKGGLLPYTGYLQENEKCPFSLLPRELIVHIAALHREQLL